MIEDINKKIDSLINEISNFNESGVVYLLIEAYKIAERKWHDRFKKQIPHIVFFRNWVAHTEINQDSGLKVADIVNDNNIKTDKLQEEILSLLTKRRSKEKLQSLWFSFEEKLMAVLKNQPVFLNQKIEIQERQEGRGQFYIQIQ